MYRVPLLIGDRDANASGGATFDRRDPVRGEVATRAAAAGIADAQAAANAAAAAFPAWSALAPGERRAILNRAADGLIERTPEFVKAMAAETGAAPMWASFNCKLAAACCARRRRW
jgi:vanillin dehydrogenase